jgi:hypothetical protein
MTITVYIDEAGAVWIANGQGDILAECFFKTEDETEDELRHMGYHRLLTVYPTAHFVAGTGLEPAELGEVFMEVCPRHGSSPPARPQRAATPYAASARLPPPGRCHPLSRGVYARPGGPGAAS